MSGRGNVWNEEERIIEACAATMLYRKRRNARLLPSTTSLAKLMKENQLSRLRNMIVQLIPEDGFRPGRGSEKVTDSSSFNEFIYSPLRDSSRRRYLLNRDISHGKEVFPVCVYSDTENCVKPEPFEYVSANDYTLFRQRLSKQEKLTFSVRCDCDDLICGESCSCRYMNDQFTLCTIMGDGRVFVNSDATFFNMLIVGCGPKCSCKGQCRNTLSTTSLPAPFKFEVFRRSDDIGFGLRTLSNIPQGCAVIQFCGEVLDQRSLSSRGAESLDYSFCLQSIQDTEIYEKLGRIRNLECEAFSASDSVVYIDPTRKGNIARFISHGCFPNLTMLRYAENDLRLSRARAVLFATQPILAGSELFFDYGSQYLSRVGFKCRCGTMWCDSVKKRWRSADPTREEITRKSLAYFHYLEERMYDYDEKAKMHLREKRIVRPEYDDLDEVETSRISGTSRPDPACVHKRDGDETPVICYNLYCKSLAKCTCKPLLKVVETVTID